MEKQVSEFYDRIAFPGHYTMTDLTRYGNPIENTYLNTLEKHVRSAKKVLDAGCGTGLTTNLFALRNPDIEFTGIDFSKSVDWACDFAEQHNIQNASFSKADISQLDISNKFDCIICQGVLHHIPNYLQALQTLMDSLVNDGKLILGLYHPWGKFAKRCFSVEYNNNILFQDQENNPFELTFTQREIKEMMPDFSIKETYPNWLSNVSLPALFNYRNGGLVVYILERNHHELD